MPATGIDTAVDVVRAQLPAVRATGYFNAGSFGPIPEISRKALVDAATAECVNGRIGPYMYDGHDENAAAIRDSIASLIKAKPSEIALMRSTGEGLNVVLNGLTWNAGDEIISTNLENPCLIASMLLLGQRYGVITRLVDIGNGGGDVVAALESAITRRTRVIAISHLQWSSGAIMPIREITALARKHDILVIVDGAQSIGQIPVDVQELGVDAYAMPGQKWLCGPTGTGALYVPEHRMADIKPTFLRTAQHVDIAGGFLVPPDGAARYEMGDPFYPMLRALRTSLAWFEDEVGYGWMFDRIKRLGARFWEGVSTIDGISLVTPIDRMAGIVNLKMAGMSVQDVASAVYDRGYVIRYVDRAPCPVTVRVSNSWWNTEEEVDGLVSAIADVARSAATR